MSGRKALPNQSKSPIRARQAVQQAVDLSDIKADITALEAFDLTLGDLAFLDAVNNSQWSGTDLAVVNGGTGASDPSTARTNLGAAAASHTHVMVDVTDITAAGRAILDDANASAQRTTLGLGTVATYNTGTSGNTVPLLDGNNTWSTTQTFNGFVEVTGSSYFRVFTTSPLVDIIRASGASDPALQLRTGSRYDRILNTSGGLWFGYNYSGTEKVMLWNGTNFLINNKASVRVTSGTAANSGLISWGTGAPGTLAEGEMYLRHA